jgi:hypothetical protein
MSGYGFSHRILIRKDAGYCTHCVKNVRNEYAMSTEIYYALSKYITH